MPSSSILFFASGSFKNLRVYRSDLPSLRRYTRGSKDVSVVFAAPAARTLVEIFVVVFLLLLLVAAIIFIVIVSPRIIIIEVPRPPLLLREVDRAEDAATLLEQGIDDNIIPNGMAVLIYFVVVPKTKRIERVTASKSSPK